MFILLNDDYAIKGDIIFNIKENSDISLEFNEYAKYNTVLDIRTTKEYKIDILLKNIEKAKLYLLNTDWYYARKQETGEEVPVDVVVKRIEAREFIRANE